MSLSLLDTNVWLSLAIDCHEHHLLALEWFDEASVDASACFCRMTQNSFLRLLTLKALFQEDTMANSQAIAAYRLPCAGIHESVGWVNLKVSRLTGSPWLH
jgi:predicted nucleic acid-binding protein